MSALIRNFFLFLLGLLVIAGALSAIQMDNKPVKDIDIGALVSRIKDGEVVSIDIKGNILEAELKDGSRVVAQKEAGESLSTLLVNYGIEPAALQKIGTAVKSESGFRYWIKVFLPFLIPFLLIGAVIFFMMRQIQGANGRAMSFGQAGAREVALDEKTKITFKDVAALEEAKEELHEIVEFLRTPKKFTALGAKIPKGVLLMGAPGTGKTLLARAVAGEAKVPFFHISGSEFVEMFVGVGASRVRDLFKKAKKNAPCIIFIDEIDAVGRQRGAGLGGSHDEREQTLNQILVEMDGFDPNVGIIIIAATNRPDILDVALLRPGRFDRRVVLDLPDIKGREEILKLHAIGKPLAKKISLKPIAQRTPGFSGADLSNLLNEAAILAARRNKKEVEMDELTEAIEKVLLGPERKSHILNDKEREITAYHEGGHALVGHELKGSDTVRKISIISRGRAAGYTLKLPSEDKYLKKKAEFLDEIAALLGGYVAEKEVFGDITTGASNDLHTATQLARKLVTEYGMSEKLGPRTFGEREGMIFLGKEIHEQRDYSEETARTIDSEINKIIKNAEEDARRVITSQMNILDRIAKLLLEKETIEEKEFETLFLKSDGKKEAKKSTGRASSGQIHQLGPAVV